MTDIAPHDQQRPVPPRPTWRGAAFAAAYGAIAATLAYVIARGSPLGMLAVMIVVGVLFRVYAYSLIRRRGDERPPWWKWL
ncbi:MAG TPA: hypothetical protein VM287_11035 [Egibacteraceae bacterium]|nr:hypothetical protein [Egibacteraceae bacterium]